MNLTAPTLIVLPPTRTLRLISLFSIIMRGMQSILPSQQRYIPVLIYRNYPEDIKAIAQIYKLLKNKTRPNFLLIKGALGNGVFPKLRWAPDELKFVRKRSALFPTKTKGNSKNIFRISDGTLQI